MKKLMVALAMILFMFIAVGISNVLAEPKPKEGNPGLPGCLATVAQLQQTIAHQQATIAEQEATIVALQEQIATLNASLTYALPKTGQTNQQDIAGIPITCDDGYLQMGIAWPDPRFTDNGDGTVTDNLTHLVWLKNANCFGLKDWYGALFSADGLASGTCGLADGSVAGNWRLPNRNELLSLVDIETSGIKIPDGHPFINAQEEYYWSSSTAQYNNPALAYYLKLYDATVGYHHKASTYDYVWPVRDPN